MKIILHRLFLLFSACAAVNGHAQLGTAPLPAMNALTGPTLEATQAWVTRFLDQLNEVGYKETSGYNASWRYKAIFKGCQFYYMSLRAVDTTGIAGHVEGFFVDRTVEWGDLHEIDPEDDQYGMIKTIGGQESLYVSWNYGIYQMKNAPARRLWNFDTALIDDMLANTTRDKSYTSPSSYINSHPNKDAARRLNKAFRHMATLCAARKAEALRPKPLVIKQPDEPF